MGLPDYMQIKPVPQYANLSAPGALQINPHVPGALQINPHVPGAKLDQGKPRMSLVLGGFAAALIQVARVGTFGAAKYTDNGWQTVPNGEGRYADAQMRHDSYHLMGETHDPESNLLHLAHAAWNALAKLSIFIKNNPGIKL